MVKWRLHYKSARSLQWLKRHYFATLEIRTMMLPHYCCNTCATKVAQQEKKIYAFAVPVALREPIDHNSNCYFCLIPSVSKRISRKKKWAVEYTNIPSALCPVLHGKELWIPVTPESYTLDSNNHHDDDQDSPDPGFLFSVITKRIWFSSSWWKVTWFTVMILMAWWRPLGSLVIQMMETVYWFI